MQRILFFGFIHIISFSSIIAQSEVRGKWVGVHFSYFMSRMVLDYQKAEGRTVLLEDGGSIHPGFSFIKKENGKTRSLSLIRLSRQKTDFVDQVSSTNQQGPKVSRGDITTMISVAVRYGHDWSVLGAAEDRFSVDIGVGLSPDFQYFSRQSYVSSNFPIRVIQFGFNLEASTNFSFKINRLLGLYLQIPVVLFRQEVTIDKISDPSKLTGDEKAIVLGATLPIKLLRLGLGVHCNLW